MEEFGREVGQWLQEHAIYGVYALVILILGGFAASWVRRSLQGLGKKQKIDKTLSLFLASIARYGIWLAASITALNALGVPTNSLIAVFASAGLALGLAVKDSLSNFASGALLLLFRPYRIDDTVKVGTFKGKVSDINLFHTTLVTNENVRVHVVNSMMTKGTIENFSVLPARKIVLQLVVEMHEDLAVFQQELVGFLSPDSKPKVDFVRLDKGEWEFSIEIWTTAEEASRFRLEIIKALYSRREEWKIRKIG